MTIDQIKEWRERVMAINVFNNLCYHDPRHPDYQTILVMAEFDDEPPRGPRNGCACDNCFYGRDALALRIIELESALTNVLVWADWVKGRRAPQMGEPNSGAVAEAHVAVGGGNRE